MRAIWTALAVVAVALAGCSGDEDGSPDAPGNVNPDDFVLAAGKGAIAGLLVDDAFRPIDLTDQPTTQYQAKGFVLVQETGAQTQTSGNGEFTFVDLDPGTYTLRATVQGHEATPTKVTVTAGQFAEQSIVARRVSTASSAVLTDEFSVFIPCAFVVPAVGLFTLNCVLDLSGDSFRSSVDKNYSAYPDLTYVVAELNAQNPSNYAFPLRDNGLSCPCYGRDDVRDGTYGKVIVANDPNAAYQEGADPWTSDKNLNIGLFYAGDIPLPENDLTGPFVGVKTGIQADFLVSLFLGEPDMDVDSYCVICGDAP